MRYCNLTFGYHRASIKFSAVQNCIGKKKTHLGKNKTAQKLIIMEKKMCLTICIVTKLHLGKCISLAILLQ